jgi:anaerobic nitric oxide reductase transcription regulator
MSGRLILLRDDSEEATFELAEKSTLGRAPGNKIAIDDPAVSRSHALVRAEPDGGFFIIDTGSANGTFVNGQRIRAAMRLHSGDIVRLGATSLRFVEDAGEIASAAKEHGRETTIGTGTEEAVLLGTSDAMVALFRLIEMAAASQIPVLIEGESGTGKELVASAIHLASERARAPYLAVNCAAFSENLLESELFGHMRGAFTGAIAERRGLFETADGGTVFLDEIGEMSLAMQPKLLRVLQEKEVTRIGELRPRRVDVRLISASNRDLLGEVERGSFRADLYYRLAAFPVRVPALRERLDDIPILAQRFLAVASQAHGKRLRYIDKEALAALAHFDWPGNVRELQNEILRAVAVARSGDTIGIVHLSPKVPRGSRRLHSSAAYVPTETPDELTTLGLDATRAPAIPAKPSANAASLHDARAAFEAKYIAQVLAEQGGNVSATARILGLTRGALHRKIKELGIR